MSATYPNPDLSLGDSPLPGWNQADRRRWGFHNLYRVFRYSMTVRSPAVLRLERNLDWRVGELPLVRKLTSTRIFSAIAVAKDGVLLHEAYALDFGPDRPHSMQSITKTTMNLVVGRLVEDGKLDLAKPVKHYLPEVGTGYAAATVQQVMDMDVINDFTEDYSDLDSASYHQEAAMGWRLPMAGRPEQDSRAFVAGITSPNIANPGGAVHYKSANTDIVGWIAERVSGRSLRDHMIDIAEAAGFEGTFHIGTDRPGVPQVNGSGCLTARDLCRYGLLFVRRGQGVNGKQVGSASFIEATRSGRGTKYGKPREWVRYSNQMATGGRWVGHGGYGGQYMLADLESGVVMAFFSVLENRDASDSAYGAETIRMGEEIARHVGG